MKINMIKISVPELNKERAKVKTEKRYLESLKQVSLKKSNYIFIDFLWVESIITLGIKNTQSIIDSLYRRLNNNFSNICFINQHISAEKLDWKNGIVFSCHANKSNDFISIPHYPKMVSNEFKDREFLFSFMGSFETHYTRALFDNFKCKEKFIIKNTGGWHYYNRIKENEINYKDLAVKSIFSLCPRGTGHGTIRLYESLKSGSIPVIISDNYKLPVGLENQVNCIIIPERDVNKIPDILIRKKSDVEKLQLGVKLYAEKYLKDDNFAKTIIENLENI